jgi:trans-aconitate methyltransferase
VELEGQLMPYSALEGKTWATAHLLQHFRGREYQPLTFLDIGCGAGNWLNAVRSSFPRSWWTGIEVFEPYVDRFALRSRYTDIIVADVRDIELPRADVIFLGDILEHMTEEDSVVLYERALVGAEVVVGSVPIIHYPQGEMEGNPYEEHLQDHLTVEKIKELFPHDEDKLHVGEIVATWIATDA